MKNPVNMKPEFCFLSQHSKIVPCWLYMQCKCTSVGWPKDGLFSGILIFGSLTQLPLQKLSNCWSRKRSTVCLQSWTLFIVSGKLQINSLHSHRKKKKAVCMLSFQSVHSFAQGSYSSDCPDCLYTGAYIRTFCCFSVVPLCWRSSATWERLENSWFLFLQTAGVQSLVLSQPSEVPYLALHGHQYFPKMTQFRDMKNPDTGHHIKKYPFVFLTIQTQEIFIHCSDHFLISSHSTVYLQD